MARRVWSGVARAILAAVFGISASISPAVTLGGTSTGVVVEEATPGFAGDKARIAPGDVILGWSRAAYPPTNPLGAAGRIETPFDLLDVEIEQARRGPLTLIGRRGEADIRWLMPHDEWRLVVHPPLPAGILELYQDGKRRIEAHKLEEEGVALWEKAAHLAAERQDWRLAGWLLLRAAEVLARDREGKRADELYARAIELLSGGRSSMETVLALWSWADSLASRGAAHAVKEHRYRALGLVERLRGESLTLARALHGLAQADAQLGDYTAAEARHRQALAMREKLAPNSLAIADSLSALGMLAVARQDVATAEEHLTDALRLRGTTPSLAHALDLSALAAVDSQRSDYITASERLRQVLPVLEKLAPSSHKLAYALFISGFAHFRMGNLATSEGYARRALQILRQLSRDNLRTAQLLQLLSFISWSRRDYALAERQGKEALTIFEAVAPRSQLVGDAVHHLGDIALARGDLRGAEEYLRRALAMDQAHSPENLIIVARDLQCLGLTLARSGRLDEGEQHAVRSADIRRRALPKSHELSRSLVAMAEIARLQGRLALAQERYEEALTIRRRVVPGSRDEAEAHHGLGLAHRQAGRLARAAESFEHAIDALEQQRGKLGGTHEAKGSFSVAYSRYYQDAMETLVALGRNGEAFRILERSRVRSLLTVLAERDLMFRTDLPSDLFQDRQLNQASYDRTYAELARLSPEKDSPEIERLLGRLRELRAEGAEITARLRAAAPRLASLQYPEPLDAAAAASVLDPKTVSLAFAVGKEKTLLFALRAQDDGQKEARLSVFTLPIGEKGLRERIGSFRRLINMPSKDQRALKARATELYDLLLRPADAVLASSERVAISPDGPLHLLPFAALVRTDRRSRKTASYWLAEWRPIYVVASATHHAELKKARREGGSTEGGLVAFGDPGHRQTTSSAPPASISDHEPRRARERGLDFGPLPFARREVEAIAALFGKEAVVYLGEEATEARVKAAVNGLPYIHFATHAVLDEALPLNSALVLSIPETAKDGEENGLLQVWEIFDTLRLDAELVTLSGCQTAVGEDMGGEGLMSLTRAFQYAGARSVLASLWRVPDQSTADLMARFYGYLKDGRSKVEALQLAQIDLIRSGMKEAHPLRWAPFVVFGDWR